MLVNQRNIQNLTYYKILKQIKKLTIIFVSFFIGVLIKKFWTFI